MTKSDVPHPLRNPEFRVLWIAELVSVAGDQLARVALTVLVFGQTGSAGWAALTYALTFLPALVGGVLLAGLADRHRRREVMIVCDLTRAVLVVAMSVPRLPLPVIGTLLVLVVLLGPPHTAAQGALLPALLPGEQYERGLAVRQISGQAAQLVGFAAGGVLVAALSPALTLLVDAGTFALSAVLLRIGVADRPRPDGSNHSPGGVGAGGGDRYGGLRGVVAGLVDIAADPRRRALVLLAWLVGCYVVPEALAAPYAQQLGAGPAAVGLLMAADPLGSVLGAWAFFRFVPAPWRARLIGVLAVAAAVPLLLTALRPSVPWAVLLWGLSGAASTAYLLQAQASFVRSTPDRLRGRAVGLAGSGIVAGQGVAILAAGFLSDRSTPAFAIAALSAVGMLLAGIGAVGWHRVCRVGRAPSATVSVG